MDVVPPPCQAIRGLVHVGSCTLNDEAPVLAEDVIQLKGEKCGGVITKTDTRRGRPTSACDQTPGSDMVAIRSEPARRRIFTGRISPSNVATPPSLSLISCSKWSRTTAVRWYDWKASQGSTINHEDVCSAARLHIVTLQGGFLHQQDGVGIERGNGSTSLPVFGTQKTRLLVHVTDGAEVTANNLVLGLLPSIISRHLEHAEVQVGDWTERTAGHKNEWLSG